MKTYHFLFISGIILLLSFSGCSTPQATPQTAEVILERSILYAEQGNFDLAISELTEALIRDPEMASAYYWRGRMFEGLARKIFAEMDTFAEDLAEQARLYGHAIADFDQAIRLSPDDAFLFLHRGAAYIQMGYTERTLVRFKYDLEGNDPGPFFYGPGFAFHDLAIVDFKHALTIDPNLVPAKQWYPSFSILTEWLYAGLANAYFDKGDFELALQLEPENTDILLRLEFVRQQQWL